MTTPPPARTITVALNMSKAFDTINIHTLIRKLLQTNIPGTIINFIANYIKGRKAYTTYRNHTSSQRQFKTDVPQGGVLSPPTLFNIYTADIPPPRAPVQVMAYADDITITSTHTSTGAAMKYIEPYIDQVFIWTKHNNLTLNPDNLHSVHSIPCGIHEKSGPQNKQNCTTHGNAPQGSGSYRTPKTHINTISVHAHKPLQIIKALTATGCGKQTETLMATYKAIIRLALEYASSIWWPLASTTSINKLQEMQNAALRTATGCTQDTNKQHLHNETLTLTTHSSTSHNTNRKHTSITSNLCQHSHSTMLEQHTQKIYQRMN